MNIVETRQKGPRYLLAALARVFSALILILSIDILVDYHIPAFYSSDYRLPLVFVDSMLVVALSSPFVWFLLIRPMRNLAASQKAQLEYLLSQIVDAIFLLDEDNRIIGCNTAAQNLYGIDCSLMFRADIKTVIECPDWRFLDHLQSAVSAGSGNQTAHLDCYVLHSGGKRIPISISASAAIFNGRHTRVVIVRDMSPIRDAEHEREASLALLEATLQSTADGILTVGWDRKVRVYNDRFVEMLAVPPDVMESRDSLKLVEHAAGLMQFPEQYLVRVDELYRERDLVSHDLLNLKDGRIIERYSQPHLIKGVNSGRVWSFRDITARVRSEQDLKQSEERFRNLADNAPVGIFETDAEGECIFVNRQWCRIAGISIQQALGKGWAAALHPDDAPSIERAWSETARSGRAFRREYRFLTPEGDENWVLGSAAAIKGDTGEIAGYMGIIIDINEQKRAERDLRESEERFRQVFEQSDDAIVLLVPGTCMIIDVNPITERMYGYSKEELSSLHFNVFGTVREYHQFIHRVCLLREEQSCRLDHMVTIHKEGSEIDVSVHAKVIRLKGEEVIYCTMRDITQRLRMEEESRAIQSQLIHTNKMTSLGLLVAGIAHEINNPNNYILANAHMLNKVWEDVYPLLKERAERQGSFELGGLPYSKLEQSLPEMMRAIREGSRRISSIIAGLKNYARTGNVVMEHQDINQVVQASLLLLKHHINKFTDRFEVKLGEDLPQIRGNAQQLEQVIINLTMNALQALSARNQQVTLSTSHDKEAGLVSLSVIDEGKGIPDAVLPKIMDPFFTTRLDSGGTGLGLSISKSIIQAHHGDISVVSREGGGTRVVVSLPVAPTPPLPGDTDTMKGDA